MTKYIAKSSRWKARIFVLVSEIVDWRTQEVVKGHRFAVPRPHLLPHQKRPMIVCQWYRGVAHRVIQGGGVCQQIFVPGEDIRQFVCPFQRFVWFWIAWGSCEKRFHDLCCVRHETVVEVDHSQELVQVSNGGWFREKVDSVYLFWAWKGAVFVDPMSEEVEFLFTKLTFLRIDHKPVLF